MKDAYKVSIKVEGADGGPWEEYFWIEKADWERIMKKVKEMNEDPDITRDWNPAREIAFGLIPEGLRKLRREKER